MRLSRILIAPILLSLVACQEQTGTSGEDATGTVTGRWYSEQQLATGEQVFLDNCALCHGEKAQGLAEDWRERLPDGSFPPPPLNGSAHAWHHPMSVLLQVISEGGVAMGGKMPGFADNLSESQMRAAIAYFQNFWSDEIYAQWMQMGGVQ